MNLDTIQRILWDWCNRTFGRDIATSAKERATRVLEEALELAQVAGVEPQLAHELASVVYARPPGALNREIAGVMVTTLVFAHTVHHSAYADLEYEMHRVLNLDPEILRRRQEEKRADGVGM